MAFSSTNADTKSGLTTPFLVGIRQMADGRWQMADGSSRSVLRRSRPKEKSLKLKRRLSKQILDEI
jgi:hypothetical protein